jgi:acetyl/propionyl-CoA carboxylase alpha subunit
MRLQVENIGCLVLVKSRAGNGRIGFEPCSDVNSLRWTFGNVRRLDQINLATWQTLLSSIDRAGHFELQVLGSDTGLIFVLVTATSPAPLSCWWSRGI